MPARRTKPGREKVPSNVDFGGRERKKGEEKIEICFEKAKREEKFCSLSSGGEGGRWPGSPVPGTREEGQENLFLSQRGGNKREKKKLLACSLRRRRKRAVRKLSKKKGNVGGHGSIAGEERIRECRSYESKEGERKRESTAFRKRKSEDHDVLNSGSTP